MSGKRSVTTIVSITNKIYLIVSVFPLRDELDFVHQITDNHTVAYQYSPPYGVDGIITFSLSFLWKSKLFSYTARIVVLVFYKLQIKLKTQKSLYIYDGPGIFSKLLTLTNSLFLLLSNQAYCVLYSLEDMSWYDSKIKVTELLDFYAIPADVIHVRLLDNNPVSLPPCSAEPLRDSKYKDLNLHCIYNITSASGYVNLSISELTVDGFDWISNYYKCFMGGAAFIFNGVVYDSYMESVMRYSIKSSSYNFDIRYLCDNYTSKYHLKDVFDKSLMDIVSDTREGLSLAVYSYKHYSQVTIRATVSTTPCKGNLYNRLHRKNSKGMNTPSGSGSSSGSISGSGSITNAVLW